MGLQGNHLIGKQHRNRHCILHSKVAEVQIAQSYSFMKLKNYDFSFYRAKTFTWKNWTNLSPLKENLNARHSESKISVIKAWKFFTKLHIKFFKNPVHLFGHHYHQYFTSQSSDKIPMTVTVIFLAGSKIKYTPPLFFSQLNIFKHVCSFFCPWLQGSAATHMISLNACWWFDVTVLEKEVLKYPRANKTYRVVNSFYKQLLQRWMIRDFF